MVRKVFFGTILLLLGCDSFFADLDKGRICLEQKKDYECAKRHLIPLYEDGNVDAEYLLAYMYLNGLGFEKSVDTAISMYLRSAKTGRADSQYNLAITLFDEKIDFATGLRWLQDAAGSGFPDALVKLIEIYRYGKYRIPQDVEKSRAYAQQLAEIDATIGKFLLAEIESKSNPEKAITLYNEAARLGNNNAMHELARRYYWGLDVAKDVALAKKHASTSNLIASKYILGLIFRDEGNITESLEALTSAANNGVAASASVLAAMYYYGGDVEKNIKEARRFAQIAYEGHSASGMTTMGIILWKEDNELARAKKVLEESYAINSESKLTTTTLDELNKFIKEKEYADKFPYIAELTCRFGDIAVNLHHCVTESPLYLTTNGEKNIYLNLLREFNKIPNSTHKDTKLTIDLPRSFWLSIRNEDRGSKLELEVKERLSGKLAYHDIVLNGGLIKVASDAHSKTQLHGFNKLLKEKEYAGKYPYVAEFMCLQGVERPTSLDFCSGPLELKTNGRKQIYFAHGFKKVPNSTSTAKMLTVNLPRSFSLKIRNTSSSNTYYRLKLVVKERLSGTVVYSDMVLPGWFINLENDI